MNETLVPLLADPNDGQTLQLHTFSGDEHTTRDGVLVNPQTKRWYPIRDGIPSLFGDELRGSGALAEEDAEFAERFREQLETAGCEVREGKSAAETDFERMESERRARDEQAEYYDKMLSLKVYERIEIPAYRKAMGEEYSAPLLEAGCGTGRFTGVFAEISSEVIAVDMSRRSILRNRMRHAGKTMAPVHYVHADLTHLPIKTDVIGRVAHCGVYEHIPSRELRLQFLEHAQRVLRPHGRLLLAAYRYAGLTKLFEKEGEHAGGIPFIRFTEEELRDEVGSYFDIKKFQPNLGIYMSLLVAEPRVEKNKNE
jgi:SAM-dependent methyltransferase